MFNETNSPRLVSGDLAKLFLWLRSIGSWRRILQGASGRTCSDAPRLMEFSLRVFLFNYVAMILGGKIVKDVMFPRQSFPLHLGVIFIWTMRLIGGWEERPKVEISIRIWGDSEIVFGRWFLSIFLRGVQHKAMVEAFQCTLQSLDDLVEACHAFNGSS